MSSEGLLSKKREAPQHSLLFRTKLYIPAIQQKLTLRTRLDDELNNGLKGRLTLVTAPAGFGKTTAVANWIRRINMNAAWFSIDSSDNSLKKFWSYLIAALNITLPGLENRFSQYLYMTNSNGVEGVITVLVDELFKLKEEFILVLDDYHLIFENSIHESLALLIKYLPENAHIVLVSRSRPSFTTIRLQTAGQVKEIRMSDLQFTAQEITEYCKERGLFVSKKEAEALETCTEGWAAGLYLLLESTGKDFDFTRQLSGSKWNSHHIDSYLTEEVMSRWSEEEIQFMLMTSVLSSMTGSLCDALTNRTDSREMLVRLSDQNAFIIAMDSEHRWYRYHHLYSEFLQKWLDKRKDFPKDTLHERAGTWYENNGYFQDAVYHYLQCGVYEKATGLIENKGREMLRVGDFSTLTGWFDCLPESLVKDNDMLCMTRAWALVLSDKLHEAEVWIHLVESRYADSSEKTDEDWKHQMEAELSGLRAIIGVKSNHPQSILQSIKRASELMQVTNIFYTSGLNFNMNDASLLAGMLGLRGHLSIVDREYAQIYDQARNVLKRRFGFIPAFMGELLFERNRIDEAVPFLMKGIDEADSNGMSGSYVPAVIALAKVMKAKGDINGAFHIVNDAEKKLRQMGGIHMSPLLSAFKIRMRMETGEEAAAEDWIRRNCLDIQDRPKMQRMYEYNTLIRALVARKEYEPCILHLSRLLLLAEKERNLFYEIEILNLLAIAYHSSGQTQKAMETIQKALISGEKEGYERIFAEEGIPMAAILGRYLRWYSKQGSDGNLPVSPAYVRKLIKQTRDYSIVLKTYMKQEERSHRNSSHITQTLTKREKDVLRFLQSEFTNAEIASSLDITVNTVKVNCTNIYRKLDVKNREQAVRCARELDILN